MNYQFSCQKFCTSKVNFEKLPEIEEFNNHTLLIEETLKSAEDLHGRLIAALRNNETDDIAKSINSAINMNKSTEKIVLMMHWKHLE